MVEEGLVEIVGRVWNGIDFDVRVRVCWRVVEAVLVRLRPVDVTA